MSEAAEDMKFKEKIKQLVTTDADRVSMLASLLGMSAVLTEYVMEQAIQDGDLDDLPPIVKYACALVSGNMAAFMSDGKNGSLIDLSDAEYAVGEQTQEKIYRKMKWVVGVLYHQMNEDERDLNLLDTKE